MSTVTYRYEENKSLIKDGVKHTIRKSVIDGATKGLSFYLIQIDNDQFNKIDVKESENNKFILTKTVNKDEKVTNITFSDVQELIKKNKDLLFVKEYIESNQYKQSKESSSKKSSKKGGAKKKSTKKSTKKSSKKSTKKSSKKSS